MNECNCNKSFSTGKKGCYYDSCYEEYNKTMPACIKNQTPDCMAKAVIPSITVETIDGLTNLANCFVHVTSINTTFYIDDKHRPMITWAGPVEIATYDIATNTLNLRSQTCYTTLDGVYSEVYFDKQGEAHVIGKEE